MRFSNNEETTTEPTSPTMPLPLSPYEQLYKEKRVIQLIGEVGDKNMNELVHRILLLSQEDPTEDIIFLINSPGGSVTAGTSLYDVMEAIPNDIVTVGLGMAASMGQFLLTAGTPGKRFATKNLEVLLHQPHGGSGGTNFDIKTSAKLINRMKNRLAGITASRTGKTLEQVNKDGDRDNWYNAEESLEYGFVDYIVEDFNDIFTISERLGKQTKKGNK